MAMAKSITILLIVDKRGNMKKYSAKQVIQTPKERLQRSELSGAQTDRGGFMDNVKTIRLN